MSSSVALDFTYKYPFASSVGNFDKGFGLKLATCGAQQENPHFFEGKLLKPREIGDMLLVLSNIVRTHFFLPRPMILDPVVTSNENMVRFEGFSGCCGVYARVDLKPEAFNAELQNRGTTNVDFNNPMRAALTKLRNEDDTWLSVGEDEVTLTKNEESVVEKKVKLPIRWIKGFSEVQAYQPKLDLALEISASEAKKFIRSLPKGSSSNRPSYLQQWGKTLRLSQREQKNSIRICGTERIRVLDPLINSTKGIRIWYNEDNGTSGWEVLTETGKFFLMISPEVYRGFSGEGQALENLAQNDWEKVLPKVQAQLKWQNQIDITSLIKTTNFEQKTLEAALAALGARGLAGYDVSTGTYFHRVLPFELDKVEALQPRLKNAKKLIEEKKVSILEQVNEDHIDLCIESKEVNHTVRLRPEKDKCTCPWFSKHLGERGPCKHILAAKMFTENEDNV